MASVQVAVRVRPFNEREIAHGSKCIIKMESNKTIIYNQKEISSFMPMSSHSILDTNNNVNSLDANVNEMSGGGSREKFKEFVYDSSYWSFNSMDEHFVSQIDVYNDLGRTTLNNAFDGYNSCICAYGQTGSGKSYSMMGQTNCLKEEGLIPRICKALFERIQNIANSSNSGLSNQTTSFRTEVSYLEIYNEKVRDLLRLSQKNQQYLKVREHPKNGVYVEDLSQHIVVNNYDIEELISRGNLNRTTASTNMNDQSSRSHAIFTIKFSQAKIVENNMPSEITSKMNLVDLAGSERADATGATGVRLKEGGNINKSLLTFINVISTLADMSSNSTGSSSKQYVPYRDSVLTWLLKDSLGGNSKTCILAAISPADINASETLSTLRYANRAKNIINKPTINEDPNVKLIRELRTEIVRLKKLLNNQALSSNLNNEMRLNENSFASKHSQSSTEEKIDSHYFNEQQQIILACEKEEKLTEEWMHKCQKCYFVYESFPNISIAKNDFNGLNMSTRLDQPYLISIEETNLSLNGFNIYPLKEGKTQFTSKSNTSKTQIDYYIHGENTECFFQRLDDNKVYWHLINGEFQLNEKILIKTSTTEDVTNDVLELKNCDILMIGEINMFKFFNPHENKDLFSSSFSKKNSLKVLVKNYFLNVKKYEFLDSQTNSINEKIQLYESIMEDQRKKIEQMAQHIEINNKETSLLRDLNQQNEDKLEISVHDLVEKFEQDEKLLNECFQNLKKPQETQLKSFIFELQNLKFKEQELDMDLKRSRKEIEKLIEISNEKRSRKLEEVNEAREEILKNKSMSDLKTKISKLSRDEMELEEKIDSLQSTLNQDFQVLETFNKELEKKKFYCENDRQTLEEASEAESETMTRARAQLDQIIRQKNQEYATIENEFEVARKQMADQFVLNNKDFINTNTEMQKLNEQESKLREFLEKCLYENDEEKSLVENELADINMNKENLQSKINQLNQANLNEINEKMTNEYKSLNDLKRLDLEELNQDEERIALLEENSIKYFLGKVTAHKNAINEKRNSLKQLENENKTQNKKMNELLNELEILENKRLIDENKVYHREVQIANEFKIEFDNLNAQLCKLDSEIRVKQDETLAKKEILKSKICSLVGRNKGLQLFEADFNPKISQHLQLKREQQQQQEKNKFEHELLQKSNSIYAESTKSSDDETEKSIYVDTSFQTLNSDSGNNSIGVSPVNDFGSQFHNINSKHVNNLKFQTFSCKALGITLDINDSFLYGKKTWDEHYEYIIDIKINDEHWKIFRRFNKIRQLHEKMSKLYSSLNRLVFPIRYFPNLIDRQMQLEHYLRCFLEILINDCSTPIYVNLNENIISSSTSSLQSNLVSNSTSLNSIVYSSNSFLNQESLNVFNKSKLCSFCSFFEETANDKSLLNKIDFGKSNSLKKILSNSTNKY